jgi:uncharacterized DUF497 family protein
VRIEYDPVKDAANIVKHGISLARAADLVALAYVPDDRYDEPRFRVYGLIAGKPHCLAGTFRDGCVRVISLRRAHRREFRRYAG